MSQNDKTKVSLESLLRLKRSERPGPEFWDGFDRDWHDRRLRALMPPVPWYVRWRRPLQQLTVALVPLGMAAAAAIWLQLNPQPVLDEGTPVSVAPLRSPLTTATPLAESRARSKIPAMDIAACAAPVFIHDSLQSELPRAAYARVLVRSELSFNAESAGCYVSDGLAASTPSGTAFSGEF